VSQVVGTGKESGRIAAAKKLWDQAIELGGAGCINHPAARAYFSGRGIDLSGLPAWSLGGQSGSLPMSIRFHPSAPYTLAGFKAEPGPCLLFQVSDREGAFRGLHQIWIDVDTVDGVLVARKRADVPNAKLLFPGISVKGCAIRFGTPLPGCEFLPIGEGPETMLAVAAACDVATWSAISAGGLLSIELPESLIAPEIGLVKCVNFMADHDRGSMHDDSVLHRKVWARPGWNHAAAAAIRIEEKYPHIEARVACPGLDTFTYEPLIGPQSNVDAFFEVAGDPAERKGVDWLDVYVANGPEAVLRAVDRSRRMQDVPQEFLASAPIARKFLMEGVDKKYLLDQEDQGDLEKEEKAKEKAAAVEKFKASIADERKFPKHSSHRAQFSLQSFYRPGECRGERWRLAYWIENSQWMVWDGKRYKLLKDHEVAGDLVHNLVGLVQENRSGRMVDVDLTVRACQDIASAILPQVTVRGDGLPFMAPPTFTDEGMPRWKTSLERVANIDTGGTSDEAVGDRDAACDLLNFSNGMLSISEFVKGRVVMKKHSPRVISRSLVPFDLDVEALKKELADDPRGEFRGGELVARLCPTWIRVLDEAFDGDEEAIGELQKVGGYLQTEDMTHEIMPVLLGPPRGSKGTIALGLSVGIGEDRVATTSFSSFGDKNETYNLVGRRAAIMTDAQQADPREMHRIVERLKTITGGDPQSVEGKFKDKNPYIYLPVVPFIISNSVPRLIDPSNALAARAIIFRTRRSFVAKEDRTLKGKIRSEAPGIMLWCLFGLRALRMSGKFNQPAASARMLEHFRRLSSPMSAFLKDACVKNDGSECGFNILYKLYKAWAQDAGLGIPGKEKFFSDLQANIPEAETSSVCSKDLGGKLLKVVRGVRPRLLNEGDDASAVVRVHTWEPNDWADFEFALPGGDHDHGSDHGTAYPQHQQGEFGI